MDNNNLTALLKLESRHGTPNTYVRVMQQLAKVVGGNLSDDDLRDAIIQHEIQKALAHRRVFVIQRTDPPYDVGYPECPCYVELRDLLFDPWVGKGNSPVEALLDAYDKYLADMYQEVKQDVR